MQRAGAPDRERRDLGAWRGACRCAGSGACGRHAGALAGPWRRPGPPPAWRL